MVTKFLNVSTDPTLGTNSNILVPSEKAVRAFIASKAIQLDFLQSTTPDTFSTGNKWLNTSDNKLYTATSDSAWDSGVTIALDQFFTYQDCLYYFDGSSINSYSSISITEQNQNRQLKTWLGTRAEYDLLDSDEFEPNTIYQVIETGVDYALLASQTQFNNSSSTTAATPYQVNQALGNYLSLVNGGNLAAGKSIGLTNTNNETASLGYNTSGQVTISSGLNVSNDASVNSLVVRSGNVYKTNTSGATIVWSDSYATTSKAGAVKPDGTTITINDGVISASGSGSLANTATGTDSLTILGTPASQSHSTNIGVSSNASGQDCTAIGYNARATGQGSIQIGNGQNSNQNTLAVGLNSTNYELLNASGIIPNARIPAATSISLGGVMLVYNSVDNSLDIRTVEESA